MKRKNKKIGLVIPQDTYLFSKWAYNYYFTELLRGAIASSGIFGWDIMIHNGVLEEHQDHIDYYSGGGVDALAVFSPVYTENDIERVKDMQVPVIAVNAKYDELNYIDSTNLEGARTAVEYLVEKGHSRIAIINGRMDTTNAKDRYEGYLKALKDNDIQPDNRHIAYGDFSEDSGYFQMKGILSGPAESFPTAVFCTNDIMALGALKAIREKGLSIPEDISVIGFDDLIISTYLDPPLTTVRQPFFHIGKEAIITLIGIANEEKEQPQQHTIDTWLIKRESVSSPG